MAGLKHGIAVICHNRDEIEVTVTWVLYHANGDCSTLTTCGLSSHPQISLHGDGIHKDRRVAPVLRPGCLDDRLCEAAVAVWLVSQLVTPAADKVVSFHVTPTSLHQQITIRPVCLHALINSDCNM